MIRIDSLAVGLLDELRRGLVEDEAVHAQLRRSKRPRHQRRDHDAEDEQRRDLDAFGPLHHVRDRGVEEHRGDRKEGNPPRHPAPRADRHRERRRAHQHQHAGGIRAALRLDIGAEDQRHDDVDAGDDDDERPVRARPFGRHAVLRQVARHEIQEPGERRRAGEPENGDRARVVQRAERRAEPLVRQIRQRAAVRRAARLKRLGRDQHGGDEAAAEQHHAHDQRGRAEQLLRVANPSEPAPLRCRCCRPGRAASRRRRSRTPKARARASETGGAPSRPSSADGRAAGTATLSTWRALRGVRRWPGARSRRGRC